MKGRVLLQFFSEAFYLWRSVKASIIAAALAYYTVLSIAPLLIVVFALVGFFFGQDIAQLQLVLYLRAIVGIDMTRIVQEIIVSINKSQAGLFTSVFGIGTFLFGSVELFYKLQIALNSMWGVDDPGRTIKRAVRSRITSFLFVMSMSIVLFLSVVGGVLLAFVNRWMNLFFVTSQIGLWQQIEFFISFIVITLLFAAAYKVLPNTNIAWKDVWIGAFFGSALFALGKVVVGWYVVARGFSSLYGAAGSFIAFLVWVYYSTQIFLFGAACTWVYAHRFGSRANKQKRAIDIIKNQLGRVSKK